MMEKTESGPSGSDAEAWPLSRLPRLSPPEACPFEAPTVDDCQALWDKYGMLPNVRRHSQTVARIATALASRAADLGIANVVAATRASALLHDLAKTWCISHGGSHEMIGTSWAAQETGNLPVCQGIILHVQWPWPLPEGRAICQLPIFVLYADKRARHSQCVSLDERFMDLLDRYGKTKKARKWIHASFEQAKNIEAALSRQLKWNLHEDTFDSGRLVQ